MDETPQDNSGPPPPKRGPGRPRKTTEKPLTAGRSELLAKQLSAIGLRRREPDTEPTTSDKPRSKMGGARVGAGRPVGSISRRTDKLSRALAEVAAVEGFSGNSLELLQLVYRSNAFDIRTRLDAANKALPYEVAKLEPTTVQPDVVPLHERLREYEREKTLAEAGNNVVDIRDR